MLTAGLPSPSIVAIAGAGAAGGGPAQGFHREQGMSTRQGSWQPLMTALGSMDSLHAPPAANAPPYSQYPAAATQPHPADASGRRWEAPCHPAPPATCPPPAAPPPRCSEAWQPRLCQILGHRGCLPGQTWRHWQLGQLAVRRHPHAEPHAAAVAPRPERWPPHGRHPAPQPRQLRRGPPGRPPQQHQPAAALAAQLMAEQMRQVLMSHAALPAARAARSSPPSLLALLRCRY